MKTPWTLAEVGILRDLYADIPTEDIAALLGCTRPRVYNKALQLGLKKSADFNAGDYSGRIHCGRSDPRMVATQFKAGHVTWNKGKPRSTGTHQNCRATQFKKGQKPANTTLPVGSYRIVKSKTGHRQLERKMTETPGPNHMRWVPVARLVWEAANGPIPAGHIVVFKSPALRTVVLEEITLDRIECVSRAEHAKRNHPRSKNPELGRLVQLKGAITRQVNRIAREAEERKAA